MAVMNPSRIKSITIGLRPHLMTCRAHTPDDGSVRSARVPQGCDQFSKVFRRQDSREFADQIADVVGSVGGLSEQADVYFTPSGL